MADFKHSSSTPQSRDSAARSPHDQGGEPVTGFVQAPRNDEDQNFEQGPGVPPNTRKIR